MMQTVDVPVWLLILIVGFAAIAALDKVMLPSVRWYLRRRLEKAVAQLNQRLERPIQPFKLARRFDMIQRLIYDPEVGQAIADYARVKGLPENVAFEMARRYAREIVPSFSASAYFGFAIRAARFVSTSLYHVDLRFHDHSALKAVDSKATVVFVMNHRSNMDYVLVTYLAAEQSALSYAVGEWARVWPLSRLIRAMGAYFIRRKKRNALYNRVLTRYVALSTEGGVTQAIFPEGGLSLDGGLAPPKLGLLKYIVEAAETSQREVVFVPVALNYDRVLEDRVLIDAHRRSSRKFHARINVVARFALRQIWLRLTGRFRPFGQAAVCFGAPMSLSGFSSDLSVEALGTRLMERIGQIMPVLGVPVLAGELQAPDAPTERAALKARFVARLIAAGVAPDEAAAQFETTLALVAQRKFVRIDGDQVSVTAGEEDTLAFYARSIAHLPG